MIIPITNIKENYEQIKRRVLHFHKWNHFIIGDFSIEYEEEEYDFFFVMKVNIENKELRYEKQIVKVYDPATTWVEIGENMPKIDKKSMAYEYLRKRKLLESILEIEFQEDTVEEFVKDLFTVGETTEFDTGLFKQGIKFYLTTKKLYLDETKERRIWN